VQQKAKPGSNVQNEQPDAVLVDLRLKESSGLELIERMRLDLPDTSKSQCMSYRREEARMTRKKHCRLGQPVSFANPSAWNSSLSSPITKMGMAEIINFGVILPSYGKQANRLPIVDTANLAESLRFDSVWTTDHLALPHSESDRFPRLFESISTAAYLAGITRHIKLGISALVLPQRHPFEVAREMATIDVLSGGRTLLAVGIGWSEGEYQNLGYNFHNRGRRMDEAVKVLRTCWRGREVVSFQGEFYSFDQAYFSPLPLQEGGPPLWVAGNSAPPAQGNEPGRWLAPDQHQRSRFKTSDRSIYPIDQSTSIHRMLPAAPLLPGRQRSAIMRVNRSNYPPVKRIC
jgi:hypothetical protein